MTTTPLRAAVIGAGSMGANHARILHDLDGVQLAAIVDSDRERAERACAGRAVPVFDSVEAMLDGMPAPDFASVVVPTGLHHAVTSRLLGAGVHVLVEKPIAATIDEANDLAARAKAKGLVLGVGHIERFNTAVQELRRRLDEGQGGRVIQVQARRVGPFPARIRDVGVIHDLAPHDIDIMRFVLQSEIVRADAQTRRHINTDHEDLVHGVLTFESGALGTLDINWLTPTKTRELTVLCERGMFVVDYIAQSLTFYENHAAMASPGAPGGVSEGPATRYPVNFREPLRLELEAFRDAVRNGGPAPVTAIDGIVALRVAESLAQSAAEQRTVELTVEVSE